MAAQYWDHAKNMVNVAEAVAIAKVAKEAKQEGNAYRVDFQPRGGKMHFWIGGRYDAISLAKDCARNNYEFVSLTRPNGEILNSAQILGLTY